MSISPHPFVGWQAAFDPLLTPGARNYWKSHDFADLSDGAIGAMLSAVRALPSPECEVFIAHVGGAMARVSPDATAWPNRAAHFVMNAHARWRDKADDGACIAWARELSETAAPFAMGSVYVNFMPEDESDRVETAYGANYRRLAEIKRRYDPDNLFRMNQNIRPINDRSRRTNLESTELAIGSRVQVTAAAEPSRVFAPSSETQPRGITCRFLWTATTCEA